MIMTYCSSTLSGLPNNNQWVQSQIHFDMKVNRTYTYIPTWHVVVHNQFQFTQCSFIQCDSLRVQSYVQLM